MSKLIAGIIMCLYLMIIGKYFGVYAEVATIGGLLYMNSFK